MNETFLPISIGILVVSTILTAIILAIKAAKTKGKNNEVFSVKMFWHAYLYGMALLSLTLFMSGGIRFTNAMFAKYISPEFSYTTFAYDPSQYSNTGDETEPVKPVADIYDPVKIGDQKIIEKDGKEYVYDYSMYKSDIVDGLTLFISLAIIFIVHRFLIYRSDSIESFFRKIYNFVGLAQFGVLTMIALPFSIYQLIRFFTEAVNLGSYNRPVPGSAISMLIFVLPAWLIFLFKMIKANKEV